MTSFSRVASGVAIYPVLIAGAVITIVPFGLGLLTSFTSAQQFNTEAPLSLPAPPTLANYTGLADAGFGRALVVTALMTAVITLGQLTFSVLAAYAFARLEFWGRDALFWVYVATLMVPATVMVVPLYLMMAEAGLRNTFWALVLPFMFGSPYAIFLLREYFRSIPGDLIRAARIDGASTLDVIAHVVLPASRPILVTLALDHRRLAVEQLHVAAGHHQWRQVAGADRRHRGTAVALRRTVDVGHGGDDGGDRAADRALRRIGQAHRALHRRDGAQVTARRSPTASKLHRDRDSAPKLDLTAVSMGEAGGCA